jgi:hypothetical protein
MAPVPTERGTAMQDSPLIVAVIFLYSAITVGIIILLFLGLRWMHRRYTRAAIAWTKKFCVRHKRVLLVWAVASLVLGIVLRTIQIVNMTHQQSVYQIQANSKAR